MRPEKRRRSKQEEKRKEENRRGEVTSCGKNEQKSRNEEFYITKSP